MLNTLLSGRKGGKLAERFYYNLHDRVIVHLMGRNVRGVVVNRKKGKIFGDMYEVRAIAQKRPAFKRGWFNESSLSLRR